MNYVFMIDLLAAKSAQRCVDGYALAVSYLDASLLVRYVLYLLCD
jgi:hypothetical protein